MAVRRHLGYYQTANSTIRFTEEKNPCLEPDMEWIGRTVCEIFAFKLYCDLETRVRGHSRSSKVALFDRAHTTLYWSKIAIVFATPPCIWRPRSGWHRQISTTTLGDEKLEWWAYQMVKAFRWYVQPFWYNTRVWQTDGQTDGQTDRRNWRGIYAL